MTKEEEQKKYSNFFTALYRAVEQEATEKKGKRKDWRKKQVNAIITERK